MSPIFKALINISIWVLFVKGFVAAIIGCVLSGMAILGGREPLMVYAAMSSVGIASLFLACLVIKFKKTAD